MPESIASVREFVEKYGLMPEKRFGQNFLFDLNITNKIAKSAGDLSNSIVLEIGPGPGGLTRAIIENGAKHLYAIEQDRRCIKLLEELQQYYCNLSIISGDALHFNEEEIGRCKIIANLPYNISTMLLIKWLAKIHLFESLTLMFQKEVAVRITARPNSKEYGRLSVMSQWLCDIKHNFDLNPRAFFPPPKVTSSVITLTPKSAPLLAKWDKMEEITKNAFNFRRKKIRTALKSFYPNAEELLSKAAINGDLRAENLEIADFVRIANLI